MTGIAMSQIHLIGYGISQLKGQLRIIREAKPIEEFIGDSNFPDSLKSKLILIQEIKVFAIDSLGINPSDNYTTFYDQKGKPLLWVVTASEPYALKSYEWEFPFLGKVTYKGFFEKESGAKEEEKLKKEGYDTDLGIVGAWSTLGWFKDPILSSMLKKREGNLANLIIHELTHGTLYIKNDVDFNENLASFIGNKGALVFLKNKYGESSEEYKSYLEDKADDELFSKYILQGCQSLDSLYKTFAPETSIETKEEKKLAMIESIVTGLKHLPFYDKEDYLKIGSYALKEKNAFFMSYVRYRSEQTEFETELELKFNGNLKAYLSHLKTVYPSL